MIWQNTSRYSKINYIKPIDLKEYLRTKKWTQEPFKRMDIIKFKSPSPYGDNNEFIEILVPLNEMLIDYTKLVELAVENISSYEERDIQIVLSQILNFADCIKSRIIEARKGMIPLNQGVSLYEGLLDLVTYSACAEYEKPAKKYLRKLERAINFAETSLMGQSELGSYVANIYIPLRRPNREFSWDMTSPFSRKVVLRILRGLGDLNDSIQEESLDPIINNYIDGLNANMCDSLVKIIDVGRGNDIILNVVLEPAIIAPDDIITTEFTLKSRSMHYLKEASKILKEDTTEEEEREFIGYVKMLNRPEEIESGTVILKAVFAINDKSANIRIELNDFDYKKASYANAVKKYVRVSGTLDRLGNRWFLRNPHNFSVIENDSELPWKALDMF